jgi:hypothetical protein
VICCDDPHVNKQTLGVRTNGKYTERNARAQERRLQKGDSLSLFLGMWHVDFACACALFIVFLFFPIPELPVSSVDRPVPKNDGRG